MSPTPAKTPITIAMGDGIGPEIMRATLAILQAAEAPLDYQEITIGERMYLSGHSSGIPPEAWETLRRNKVFLKGPITTPQGTGYKSLNVTIRKTLGLYANVRPCVAYAPFIETRHPKMDLVIVRENEEDLYAGIEHRQTDQVYQCLKLISRPGCERIVRYAFQYARDHNRRKVACFVKDNIMKLTDGLFHKVFDEVDAEFTEFKGESWIVDIGAARLADTPEIFDVIVMPNLYGDIMSDIAAQITGSVGLGGSANIGDECAMFEAIHGSAPPIAGQNIANPSGVLLGAVMMLVHLQMGDVATKVHNAWLRTIEDGVHTFDIYREGRSKKRVHTDDFAQAVIERLGQKPEQLKAVDYTVKTPQTGRREFRYTKPRPAHKDLVGIDVFVDNSTLSADQIGQMMHDVEGEDFDFIMLTNRGVKVWPDGYPETFCTDHWRGRYRSSTPNGMVTHEQILGLLARIHAAGFDFIKTEHLYNFDGKPGYSLGAGE